MGMRPPGLEAVLPVLQGASSSSCFIDRCALRGADYKRHSAQICRGFHIKKGRSSERPFHGRNAVQAQAAFISATVASSMRLLNPHSLSYQLLTLTRRPDTLVNVASKIDECALWLKST